MKDNERDELADLLMSDDLNETAYVGRDYALAEADAILAAGYRRPQTITTVWDLEDIPKGAVVLASNGEVWRKYTHKWDNLDEPGDLLYPPHHIPLPATVLHEPEPQR